MNKELDEIWKLLAEVRGCKKNKEDCTFSKCHSWGQCELLVPAILLWHDREKRKWAGDFVGEVKTKKLTIHTNYGTTQTIEYVSGYNTAKAEIRARLERG